MTTLEKIAENRRYIGSTLKLLRCAQGLGQGELAHLVGCSRVTINEVEQGKANPGIDMVARIAHALRHTYNSNFVADSDN